MCVLVVKIPAGNTLVIGGLCIGDGAYIDVGFAVTHDSWDVGVVVAGLRAKEIHQNDNKRRGPFLCSVFA